MQFHSRRHMDIPELFQMKQVIADPTYIISNTASLLDIIQTNRHDIVKESGMIHMGISDHTFVYKCLNVLLPQKKSIVEIKDLKNYNIDHFNSRMSYLLTASSWDKKISNHLWGQQKNIQCFRYTCST